MNLVKRNNEILPSLMDELFGPDWFGGKEIRNQRVPAMNSKENDTNFELELLIPGRKKEDIKIEIDKDILTVSSELLEANKVKNESYSVKEFAVNSFKKSFNLPKTIDSTQIIANYEAGVLRFVFPKKEEALPTPKRVIEIG